MRALMKGLIAVALLGHVGVSGAVEIGIASFNLAWAGTVTDFERHLSICRSPDVKWCDARAKTQSDADIKKAAACQAAFDKASGSASEAMLVAPCNAYKLKSTAQATASGADYQQKLNGLTSTIEGLISGRAVDVIAFQEVRSAEVIASVLGKHSKDFDTCVASHTAFQTVGFAWRKSVTSIPGACVLEAGLSIKENQTETGSLKSLRPGLSLALKIGDSRVTFLNLHLKSACANLVTGGGFLGRLLTDVEPACRALNRQVKPLEDWIEATSKKSPYFVVLGDFNRRIDEEASAQVKKEEVRGDGSNPSSPNVTTFDGSVTSRYLWQEIADGDPDLVQVPLSSAPTACKGFDGLDHILLSKSLADAQKKSPTSEKTPVDKKNGQLIATSDHCPRATKLAF